MVSVILISGLLLSGVDVSSYAVTDTDNKFTLAPPLTTQPQNDTLLRNEWIVAEIGRLIYPILKLTQEGKFHNPAAILIPHIKKNIDMTEVLLKGFDIDGIEEVREGGEITGFAFPVTRNGTSAYQLVYNLRGGDTAIQMRDGASIYIKAKTVTITERLNAPWINQGIMYEIMIKDFGSIVRITKEIPRLNRLGIRTIWLCGVMSNRNGNEPFAVLDNFKLEPSAGTEEQLKRLLEEAHSNGIKVIMDLIPNHVSEKSHLLEEHPGWFIRDEKGKIADATDDVAGNYKWPGLSQLDVAKIEVQNHIMNVARHWLRFGFDGFRIDASLSLTKERIKKNWYQGREEIVDKLMPEEFWAAFTSTLKREYPHTEFFAEAHEHKEDLEKTGIDLVLDIGFSHVLYEILIEKRPAQDLRRYLEATPFGSLERRAHLKDGHDVRDLGCPPLTGDQRLSRLNIDELRLALLLITTIPGAPVLYNGESEAVLNYAYKANEQNPILWDRYNETLRAFNENVLKLCASPIFRKGAFSFLEQKEGYNANIIAFKREYNGEKIVVVANLSDEVGRDGKSCVNLDIDNLLNRDVKAWRVESVLEKSMSNPIPSAVIKEHGLLVSLGSKEIQVFRLTPYSVAYNTTVGKTYSDIQPSIASAIALPESERIHAANFQDMLTYIQTQPQSESVIIALGTSWIKGYERREDGRSFKHLQGKDLNELITSIRNYCESKGIPFIVDDDDKLLARINAERAKDGRSSAKIVVLAGENAVKSDEFARLRADEKNAFVVGINNQELTTDSYIRLMEMLTLALKLSAKLPVSLDNTRITITKDNGLNIYIFLPHAEPMDHERLKVIYEVQKFA